MLGVIQVGDHEQKIGVGGEVELAHAQAAQRDHHELIAHFVARRSWRMSSCHLLQRHAVGSGDGGVG